jgi:hypothetical protein
MVQCIIQLDVANLPTSKIFLPLPSANVPCEKRRESGEGWQNDSGQNDGVSVGWHQTVGPDGPVEEGQKIGWSKNGVARASPRVCPQGMRSCFHDQR